MKRSNDIGLGLGLAFVAASLTAFQVVLLQIFSYLHWHHFAFLVVSIALLGFGASGTFLSLFRRLLSKRADTLVPLFSVACGLALPGSIMALQGSALQFEFLLLFTKKFEIFKFVATCLILTIPFFLGATGIALVLFARIRSVGSYYFANLAGSGVGGILGTVFLITMPPERLPAAAGVLPVIGSVFMTNRRTGSRQSLITATAFGAILLMWYRPPTLHLSQFKDVQYHLNLPDAYSGQSRPHPRGYLQVVYSSAFRSAPGLSLTYEGELCNTAAICINGDNYGSLPDAKCEIWRDIAEFTLETCGYAATEPARVLLLRPGSPGLVSAALTRGADHVVVVEPHPHVRSLLQQFMTSAFEAGTEAKLIEWPAAEPREYLSRSRLSFDLIRYPTVGAFGANTGLNALEEDFLLTREAFQGAWNRLNPDGALMVTSWIDYPARDTLRTLALLADLVAANSTFTSFDHIAAVRSWSTVLFVVKKRPLVAAEIGRIRTAAHRLKFDPLILPDLEADERQRFNATDDTAFFNAVDAIVSGDSREFLDSYAFDIRPPTDNRPYFSHSLRLRSIPDALRSMAQSHMPMIGIGALIVPGTIVLLSLLSAALILIPLSAIGWSSRGKAFTLLYFSGLGAGYMTLEIAFMQTMTLFLGSAVYATATVISCMLFISGIGSYLSSRLPATQEMLPWAVATVPLVLLPTVPLVHFLISCGLHLDLAARVVLAIVVLAPLNICLGALFPLGLRLLDARIPQHLPWAWGINGCVSVVVPAGALMVALQTGIKTLFILAGISYLAAGLASRILRE